MLIQGSCFRHVWNLVKERGYELVNADCTIIAQKPKMAPILNTMKEKLHSFWKLDSGQY